MQFHEIKEVLEKAMIEEIRQAFDLNLSSANVAQVVVSAHNEEKTFSLSVKFGYKGKGHMVFHPKEDALRTGKEIMIGENLTLKELACYAKKIETTTPKNRASLDNGRSSDGSTMKSFM